VILKMGTSVVSTSWNAGYLVAAAGKFNEVQTTMTNGAKPLLCREYLLAYSTSTPSNVVAIWYYKS